MKIGPGWILGVVGGILALVGSFLPWISVSDGTTTLTLIGAIIPIFGWLFLIFAILGLILVAIPNKITAILGMVFGILALIMGIVTVALTSLIANIVGGTGTGVTVSIGYGAYVALVGAVLLMIGGPIAYSQWKKAAIAPAAPAMMPPPMSPPQ